MNAAASMNASESLYAQHILCFHTSGGWLSSVAFAATSFPLLLPTCLYVLLLGLRQWRRRAQVSHTDAFTYHVSAFQLLGAFASVLNLIAIDSKTDILTFVGFCLLALNSAGFVLFQILTCAERYVAVVHPVVYLRLRRRTLARNVTCALGWLLCVMQAFCSLFADMTLSAFVFSYVALSLSIAFILFCNISVLVVLLRPRPGDGARTSGRMRRSFYTMLAILGGLVLKAAGDITANVITSAEGVSADTRCGLWFSMVWFSLPCTLTLPLLYLHRNGKLPGCRRAEPETTGRSRT